MITTLMKFLYAPNNRDHAGGNENLVSMVSGLTVCGNDDRIGALNKRVKHNESFKVCFSLYRVLTSNFTMIIEHLSQLGGLTVNCLETPCHTSGHICYYVHSEDKSDKVVFTGKIHLILVIYN